MVVEARARTQSAAFTVDGRRMELARRVRRIRSARAAKTQCYKAGMIDSMTVIRVMNDDDLLASTRKIARKSCGVEAELLLFLGEIDARKLYRERASPSMLVFCMREFGFSEGAAYNRIFVARAARELPAILDALRSGRVHLAGLRVLAPHLSEENHERILALAAGKSKREIEEIAAALCPKPPVPDDVRKLRDRAIAQPSLPLAVSMGSAAPLPAREERRAIVVPLSAETFKIQFTASRAVRDKPRQAQELLRHRLPNGDLATVFEKALDALIVKVMKERFALGRKPRRQPAPGPTSSASHDLPDPMKREVYLRDQGRCAFVDENGNRCPETGGLEFDHIDGLAQTHVHDVDRSRLLCRVHNQLAAEQLYGRVFMERLRQERRAASAATRGPAPLPSETPCLACPGASQQQRLF